MDFNNLLSDVVTWPPEVTERSWFFSTQGQEGGIAMRILRLTVGAGLLLLMFGLVFSGCVSSPATATNQEPAITTNEDPSADFSIYRTYNYIEPLAIMGPDGTRPLVGTFVVNAINREMEVRGFARSNSPDLLVNFDLYSKTKVAVGSSRVQRRYNRARYGSWGGYQNPTQEYRQGTLIIDLVDARRKVVVWEGLAQGYMRTEAREVTQDLVDEVVNLIFVKFSHRGR
jgi:hypothetical protein